jgi:hypothetical protein
MPELEDMRQFATRLVERRNRAALLLTPDLPGQQAYAARLAGALNAPHLDVLTRFQEDQTLLSRLTHFSFDDLLALIAEHRQNQLLVVSGIEFLLGAWLSQHESKQFKTDLCRKIEFWQQSPAFILVTHEDPVFAAYHAQRFSGSRVVLHTSETLSLE